MKASKFIISTLRDAPNDAVISSHKLMMRSGMTRKLGNGLYAYMPLGYRSYMKVQNIIREELDKAGCLEMKPTVIQPGDLWKESGRWDKMGEEMLKAQNRQGQDMVVSPTAEEAFTALIREGLSSYKQLPFTVYQINTKYRDEIRPRYGVMRGREFTMMDAYSFDKNQEDLDSSYENVAQAYRKIFKRMGLKTISVKADTGAMGGSGSEEFMVESEVGDDTLILCPDCSYAANVEKAACKDEIPLGNDENPQQKTELPKFNIPLRTEKSLTIMQDVEQPYINVFLFNQDKGFKTVKTNDDMELQLTNEIARNIFNIRMQEITSSPDSKWLQAGMSTVSLVSSSSENYAYFVPKTAMFEDSLKSFLDNIDRFVDYGVTQTELDREKELLLNKAELSFQNKDKIYNSTYANQITNHVLTGVAAPSEETILNLYKEILPRITVEKVNVCAAKAFENRATDMLVIASPKEKIPSQEEINSIWKDYKNSEIQAYTDEDYNKEFMKKPSKKAKISSTKNNKNLGVNEYVLENGIKIITKKTDFERNFVLCSKWQDGCCFYPRREQSKSKREVQPYRNSVQGKAYA